MTKLRTDVVPLFYEHGEMTETLWDTMRVLPDTTVDGKILNRDFAIKNMRRKRSMLPNHAAVRRDYDNKIREGVNSKNRKESKISNHMQQLLDWNQNAEDKLTELDDVDFTIPVKLSKLKVCELRGFICARHTHTNSSAVRNMNKGKLTDDVDIAFSVFNEPVIVSVPEPTPVLPVPPKIAAALVPSRTGDPPKLGEIMTKSHVTSKFMRSVHDALAFSATTHHKQQHDVIIVANHSHLI